MHTQTKTTGTKFGWHAVHMSRRLRFDMAETIVEENQTVTKSADFDGDNFVAIGHRGLHMADWAIDALHADVIGFNLCMVSMVDPGDREEGYGYYVATNRTVHKIVDVAQIVIDWANEITERNLVDIRTYDAFSHSNRMDTYEHYHAELIDALKSYIDPTFESDTNRLLSRYDAARNERAGAAFLHYVYSLRAVLEHQIWYERPRTVTNAQTFLRCHFEDFLVDRIDFESPRNGEFGSRDLLESPRDGMRALNLLPPSQYNISTNQRGV